MGAVQKLATVVIIGLVALATVLTVYIAREPDRRTGESTEQNDLAIERGADLFIKYCLQCHAPDGTGRDEPNTDRIGAPLNQGAPWVQSANPEVVFQSDNPADQAEAEEWIHYRITYGVPAETYNPQKIMPAFGSELNNEEVNDLIYLIMHGDWNYVYNRAVQETGQTVAQADCDENNGQGEYCDNIEEAPPVYPTAPAADTGDSGGDSGSGGDGGATPAASAEAAAQTQAEDSLSWSNDKLTVKPGDTIEVVPSGGMEHDFVVDELGIKEILAPGGDSVMITIPEDAKPGDYTFYCSVPGHQQAGMEGTLTIEG